MTSSIFRRGHYHHFQNCIQQLERRKWQEKNRTATLLLVYAYESLLSTAAVLLLL